MVVVGFVAANAALGSFHYHLEWIYASWGVWIADGMIRIVRMVLFGVRDAELEYLGSHTFKVKVPHNKYFKPSLGSYAYVYFMTPALFWQSHPFTIIKTEEQGQHITFFMKIKEGITNRIKKSLIASPDGTKTMKVCIEGAYGHRAPVDKYDKVLLISSGNGITGVYTYAIDLAKRALRQQVKLTWVIGSLEPLLWFKEELRYLEKFNIQVDIYVTRKIAPTSDKKSSEKNTSSDDLSSCEDPERSFPEFKIH